jgi:methylmalonyl-CoA mutase
MRIAVISVDPTRRRTGGALLGDRIRMNSLRSHRVYMRSMATRRQNAATNAVLKDCIAFLKSLGYDLVIVETAGIGQSDSEIVDLVDFPMYVMTSDYGAASQLEKIDMLDFAELIVLNKYDKRGAEDALRDVRKQWKRNRVAFRPQGRGCPGLSDHRQPVQRPRHQLDVRQPVPLAVRNIGNSGWSRGGKPDSAIFGFSGDRHLAQGTARHRADPRRARALPGRDRRAGPRHQPPHRDQAEVADRAQSLWGGAAGSSAMPALPPALVCICRLSRRAPRPGWFRRTLSRRPQPAHPAPALQRRRAVPRQRFAEAAARMAGAAEVDHRRSHRIPGARQDHPRRELPQSLSHQPIPKIAAPTYRSWGELLTFLGKENLPGSYPYTGGVYPYRRTGEDPIRMFAGEGTPERTNRRFHYLSVGQPAARLSTAFDSVTLYGEDPAPRPDIYGKIGNSGVNIPTLDDMKKLYSGFDLCAPDHACR